MMRPALAVREGRLARFGMSSSNAPIAVTTMLIRRPVAEVFESFIDPAITSRFWFSRGSGMLRPGALLTWYWDTYDVSAQVVVETVEQDRRIVIRWPSPVEWEFEARGEGETFVRITASGFEGTNEEQVSQALDSMGGFSFLLAGCKAYLEHGIELHLVRDHHPLEPG